MDNFDLITFPVRNLIFTGKNVLVHYLDFILYEHDALKISKFRPPAFSWTQKGSWQYHQNEKWLPIN